MCICFYHILNNNSFYCCSLIVVPILPLSSPLPTSTVSPHPVVHVCGSFILVLNQAFPFLSSLTPLCNPCQVLVSRFLVSMPLILFCSFICFVHQVPIIGEIIWYLYFDFIFLCCYSCYCIFFLSSPLSSPTLTPQSRSPYYCLCPCIVHKCPLLKPFTIFITLQFLKHNSISKLCLKTNIILGKLQ